MDSARPWLLAVVLSVIATVYLFLTAKARSAAKSRCRSQTALSRSDNNYLPREKVCHLNNGKSSIVISYRIKLNSGSRLYTRRQITPALMMLRSSAYSEPFRKDHNLTRAASLPYMALAQTLTGLGSIRTARVESTGFKTLICCQRRCPRQGL